MRPQLLPPSADACPVCAVEHEPSAPHNAQSLYYQMRFQGLHGRWPTWADAVAHCDERTRGLWRAALRDRGAWSEPLPGVDVIAEPLAESLHQLVAVGSEPVTVRMSDVSPASQPGESEVDALLIAWRGYRVACYGDQQLGATQERECRQAFLSGVHWRNELGSASLGCDPDAMRDALRKLLTEGGE